MPSAPLTELPPSPPDGQGLQALVDRHLARHPDPT